MYGSALRPQRELYWRKDSPDILRRPNEELIIFLWITSIAFRYVIWAGHLAQTNSNRGFTALRISKAFRCVLHV